MPQHVPTHSMHPARGLRALGECSSFATLARRATRLDALDRALRQTLPEPLRSHVRFADLRRGRLVFVVASPAWASRLRLAQGQIIASARAIGVEAAGVQAKVGMTERHTVVAPPARTLPPGVASHLRASAASAQDPELKAIYLRLAAIAADAPRRPR